MNVVLLIHTNDGILQNNIFKALYLSLYVPIVILTMFYAAKFVLSTLYSFCLINKRTCRSISQYRK